MLKDQGAGLAFLCGMHSRDAPSPIAVLSHVFELAGTDRHLCSESNGDIDFVALEGSIKRHVQQLHAQQPGAADADQPSTSNAAREQPGRLGPQHVAIDRSSVCGTFSYSSDQLTIESMGNFSSCRANVAVFSGKWMYECTVLTPGIQQIGWATITCPFTAEEGVGDAPDSYAVDGKRQRKWSVKPQPYGEAWVQGDIIGCALDLDAKALTFYRNGQSMGVAYDRVRTMQPSLAYFPAVSLSHTERCTLNFGAKPFVYPVEGFQPLQAPPAEGALREAQYFCSCLSRLVRLAAEQQHGNSSSNSSSGGNQPAGAEGLSSGSSKAATADAQLSGEVPPAGSALVAAAAAAAAVGRLGIGCPSSCSPRHSAAGWGAPLAGSVALSSADVLLLAAVVLEPLQQLLVLQPYLVHSALLPLLLELHREGKAQQQQQQGLGQQGQRPRASGLLLQLLYVVWQEGFGRIMFSVLEELAYRCQVSPLLAQEFPDTAGYPYLSLAASMLQAPAVMRLFVSHPDFNTVLEGLLTRKSPSPKDLQQLLPHVWWAGCSDETASEERLKASVSIITATLAKIEQCHGQLMELLLATPWQQSSSDSSSTDCALLVFLRFLLQKNRGALRDVPPPGLSEPTVLMTTFFGLLRLLQPALTAALESGTGPLAAFPAAELLTESGSAAEALPVFDIPRLGGVVSHLAREHPISDVERQPIAVQAVPLVSDVSDTSMTASGGHSRDSFTSPQQVHQHSPQQAQQLQLQQPVPRSVAYVAPPALLDVWVPELLNSCMLLYCWRVGFSYKMIHNLASSVASSSHTLDELDRMIATSSAEGGEQLQAASWLLGTRKVYRDELTRDVRLLTLLRVAFFSPDKQVALATLSRYLATLLSNISTMPLPNQQQQEQQQQGATAAETAAVASASSDAEMAAGGAGSSSSSADRGGASEAQLSNLLRYVPVVYIDVIIDYLNALRRNEEQGSASGMEVQPQSAAAYVGWLCGSLNDPCIANPDVQENMLQVAGMLLGQPTWRSVVEASPALARQLLSSLLVVFDSRLWHPASGVLLKVLKDCGFGHAAPSTLPASSLQHILLELLDTPAAAVAAARPPAATDAQAAAAAARTKGFLNRLFNTLNWTLTEFTVSVGDLHNLRGRRSILEAQNQYRRTGLMFELSVNFMRILEFVVPTHSFLCSTVNRTRLRELLQFVLSHFTTGPDARRLNEILQASQPAAPGTAGAAAAAGELREERPTTLANVVPAYAASAMRFESNSLSERVQKRALLAPVMGVLLALWDAHTAAAAATGGDAAAAAGSGVLQELAEMADERFMSALRFMQDIDWCAAFPSQPLSGPLRAYSQLLDALAAARAAHESAAAGQALPEDVPDDFCDPITMDLMRDPVRLPDSQIVVDRSTIERHLLSSETDPFSRAPLKPEQLLPEEDIKGRIQQWLAQCQQQKQKQMQEQQDAK